MRAIARSFARHFNPIRLIVGLFLAAFVMLTCYITAPGGTWHPWGSDCVQVATTQSAQ